MKYLFLILTLIGCYFVPKGEIRSLAISPNEMQSIHAKSSMSVSSNELTQWDAYIAVFDAKYAFLVRRPNQLDPQLKTVLVTPNHPSYPAGHTAIGGAATAILSFYFPENQTEWERLLGETGMSRIQAGIHFPIDVQTGSELGNQVGNNLMQTSSEHPDESL